MNGKFFLDTNIFAYSFDQNAVAKARRATQLIGDGVATGKGIISYQVVQEFFNIALKRFHQPMTPTEAEQYLSVIFRPMLAVHSSPALFSQALHLLNKHRLAWYDSLIVAAAVEAQCGILFSEDLNHGQKFGTLQIQNPFI
jgi:predicted nucleic acid-binding protein